MEDEDNIPDWLDDGNHDSYLNERDFKLNQFRDRLVAGDDTFYYDEDEWIMLADYASDIEDFFLYNEAVTRGLINFPNSVDLQDRRLLGMMEACSSNEMRMAFSAAAARTDNPSKFVRLSLAFYSWEDLPEGERSADKGYEMVCNEVLDGFKLQDFDVIETVKVVEQMDALTLMVRDMKLWEDNCEYPEMLWYEIMSAGIENELSAIAEPAVEKLTAEFPYNCTYWMYKARIMTMKLSNSPYSDAPTMKKAVDEIIEVIDTALAIDPDDPEANEVKQRILGIRNDLGTSAYIIGTQRRRPEQPMALRELLDLINDKSPKAAITIMQWILHEVKKFETDIDEVDFRMRTNLTDLLECLYILGILDSVDSFVALITAQATIPHPTVQYLVALRHIENERFDEAAGVIESIPTFAPDGSIDPNKKLLLMLLNRKTGVETELRHYHTIGNHLLNVLTDNYPENARIVSPSVLNYITVNNVK